MNEEDIHLGEGLITEDYTLDTPLERDDKAVKE